MDAKATFQADFSSFNDAVKQSAIELRSFEEDAAKVEDQLTRMGNRFSGQKIVQEATLMAEAIERAGGTATLTDKELERVGRTANEAAEKMRALGQDVPANLQQLADATKKAGDETESLSVSVTDMVKAYVTAEAILGVVKAAFSALTGAVTASIASASEAEQADRALLAALEAQGTAVPSVVDAYQGYAAALQQTTIYSDDTVTSTQRLLAQIGGVMPRDMEKATIAVTNLAAATGKDLNDAALMVAKAANGSSESIEKLGVQMTDAEGKSLSFATQIDNINAKFSGAAAASADTYAGKIAQLENAWDNVQESVGRVIIQNQTVQTLIKEVTGLVQTETGELKNNQTATNLVSDAVIMLAKSASIGAEGIQFIGTAALATSNAIDAFALGLTEAYTWLQKIELFTQKKVNWALGTDESAKRIKEAGDNLAWAADQTKQLTDDMAQNVQTNASWTAGINAMQEKLDALVVKMEAARGKTTDLTAAANENTAAWAAHTGGLGADVIALDEVAKGVGGLKIGFDNLGAGIDQWGLTTKVASLGAFGTLKDASADAFSGIVTGADGASAAVFKITTEATQATQAMSGLSSSLTGINFALPQGGSGQPYAPAGYVTSNVNPMLADELSRRYGEGRWSPVSYGNWNSSPSASNVTVESGAVTMNYPVMNDPQALNGLANVVGDAIMRRLTGTGIV
jgi:hypothetical protein